MYYQGTPFIDRNRIAEEDLLKYRSFFIEEFPVEAYIKKMYKRVTQKGDVKLVIYSEIKCDERLLKYHKDNFGNIPFHIEKQISLRTIKTMVFFNFKKVSVKVFIYDALWRVEFEQWYDENLRLVEYRKLLYRDESRKSLPYEEKIFFAENWTISIEKYDC